MTAAHVIVTRAEARAAGLVRYFTGKPCKYGHVAERGVASKTCMVCVRSKVQAHVEKRGDYYRAKTSAWAKANPARKRANDRVKDQTRRARKADSPGHYTAKDVKDILKQQRGRCALCRVSLKGGQHEDHVVALKNGGTNDRRNIQLLCPPCNLSKGATDQAEFMRRRGFLL